MRHLLFASLAASTLLLAACGGDGDDALAENAEDAAEMKADNLEAMADNATGAREDQLEAQADVAEDVGEARAEAIDDSDVNAHTMTPAERAAAVNGQ